MQFLRTLFWVVLAVVAVIFSTRNWTTVTVKLFGGVEADAKLPVLLFGAFLLGLLPTLAFYRAMRWRMRRRLDSAERAAGIAQPGGSGAETVKNPTDDELPIIVPPTIT